MPHQQEQIKRLSMLRNSFGDKSLAQKWHLLNSIDPRTITGKQAVEIFYSTLLFMLAYPDNKKIYELCKYKLQQLQEHIRSKEKLRVALYNSGITGTRLCAAFSFELVKWLRATRPMAIRLVSFEAGDAQIQSVLSVVMLKLESEIMQDANENWKSWLAQLRGADEDLLDQFISIFDSSDLQPAVKAELWNSIGINVEIDFDDHCCLPETLVKPFYHRALAGKRKEQLTVPVPVKLTVDEAEKIIDCSRMILARKLRELDPVTCTGTKQVSFYPLKRGYAIALMGMKDGHRHPIDSYMGYLVFKHGLPVAYAGSWILFDSARIGLNVFYDYRGGEAKYIFDQVLQLHAAVYGLHRFTVDPYQLGKENSDGISSGAYWIYYRAGFRSMQKEQYELAEAEAAKIKKNPRYRTSATTLKKLANSRMQLVFKPGAFSFDATDLSRAYAGILKTTFKGNRGLAEKVVATRLAAILHIKDYREPNMHFVLKNWGLLLLNNEKELRSNYTLKRSLKKLVELKAHGSEEAYIHELQKAAAFRMFIERML